MWKKHANLILLIYDLKIRVWKQYYDMFNNFINYTFTAGTNNQKFFIWFDVDWCALTIDRVYCFKSHQKKSVDQMLKCGQTTSVHSYH